MVTSHELTMAINQSMQHTLNMYTVCLHAVVDMLLLMGLSTIIIIIIIMMIIIIVIIIIMIIIIMLAMPA